MDECACDEKSPALAGGELAKRAVADGGHAHQFHRFERATFISLRKSHVAGAAVSAAQRGEHGVGGDFPGLEAGYLFWHHHADAVAQLFERPKLLAEEATRRPALRFGADLAS